MSKPSSTHPTHFLIVWHRANEPDKPQQWSDLLMTKKEAERKVKQYPTRKFGNQVLHARIWNNTLHPLETTCPPPHASA